VWPVRSRFGALQSGEPGPGGLGVGHVERDAAQVSRAQELHERLRVKRGPPPHVHHQRARAQRGELGPAQKALRPVGAGQHGDQGVALGERAEEPVGADDPVGRRVRARRAAHAEHPHPDRREQLGDPAPDAPQPDDGRGPPRELHRLGEPEEPHPPPRVLRAHQCRHAAGERQEGGERRLGHRLVVGAARARDEEAAPAEGRAQDLVRPGARGVHPAERGRRLDPALGDGEGHERLGLAERRRPIASVVDEADVREAIAQPVQGVERGRTADERGEGSPGRHAGTLPRPARDEAGARRESAPPARRAP
jgi:hypothetical protein